MRARIRLDSYLYLTDVNPPRDAAIRLLMDLARSQPSQSASFLITITFPNSTYPGTPSLPYGG